MKTSNTTLFYLDEDEPCSVDSLSKRKLITAVRIEVRLGTRDIGNRIEKLLSFYSDKITFIK